MPRLTTLAKLFASDHWIVLDDVQFARRDYDDSMDGIDESAVGEALGVAPMAFKAWFTPFNEGRYVHPSAADEPEGAAHTGDHA
ncbi:WbqC family protein [Streptomyces sp. SID8014]|nr:WbqC family protein [Streptomyces sp. SID8014]